MKSNKHLFLWLLALEACNPTSLSNTATTNPSPTGTSSNCGTATNAMKVTVNGSLCNAQYQYANQPCVSVTICSPSDPNNCQTIDNMLLDTGSYGVRIFSSVLKVPLTPVMNGKQNVAECVQYGGGTSQWGSVQTAMVKLAGEKGVTVPIMVIDPNYATRPSEQDCPQLDSSPQQVGFNGILGLGTFQHDCGDSCTKDDQNGVYYNCSDSACTLASASLEQQVQNPVSLLETDNNGVVVVLPSVASQGAPSIDGCVYLGIGTQSNNTPPSTTTAFPADKHGNMATIFSAYSSEPIASFIDTGSNSYTFPAPSNGELPLCNGSSGSPYCPATLQTFQAINSGTQGSPTNTVSFDVGNTETLFSTSNWVFNDNASSVTGTTPYFDWGLPFSFGKSIFVGIEGAQSNLGTGPYWGY